METMDTKKIEREVSLLERAPNYFRACVAEAASRKVIAHDQNTGKAVRADYSHPGYHLAIHIDEYLSEEALEELYEYHNIVEAVNKEQFLLQFFEKELPSCMALVPKRRRNQFINGVFMAIEQDRFPV